jgi:malonyl CoA-acyl carrier protein transacylase
MLSRRWLMPINNMKKVYRLVAVVPSSVTNNQNKPIIRSLEVGIYESVEDRDAAQMAYAEANANVIRFEDQELLQEE